ncbi:MAG: hypothetical protein LUG50_11655 [Planctomycetaceae bacterium]|nr:hypothetical protein [Planctomycetaceae bacterium]
MRSMLTCIIYAFLACTQSAAGGEGGRPVADIGSTFSSDLHFLMQFGALGFMVYYLICDIKETRKARRDEDKRWQILDERVIVLVEKTVTALTSNTNETIELRQDVAEIKAELRHLQVFFTGGTRVIERPRDST